MPLWMHIRTLWNFVNSDTEAAAEIIGNHDIISAEVAVKAIPQCSIVFMEVMKCRPFFPVI